MIHFVLLQNRQGKTRLSKWYNTTTVEERQKMESEIHRMIVVRDPKYTNFVEFKNFKIIYRKYAGLYFSLGVDSTENELTLLEIIHLFVEVLDQYFGNVCELDLVFNFHKVYGILDEMIIGGEIMETSKALIIGAMRALECSENVA
mmetsp:Transcript_41846/g.48185  ORF Transcript_41846/g.48185 Transcript_41846/m.48185 type:complete len:146 (+) Transcript_41846:70-507(+)|eukprot:CAMPEP_0115011368 /NCGR_PEP_ID=MMETSP0216-20121206/23941_1 /TAXON_ID=223996 /ORGANISM="Protocruzia adherens, Strain Boccale" /LENGTH=145 /DNA_ID=CAMNT_0002379903 /DNA_START=50 /DNA_END=487 /DNA_ORIENTATION=-